MRAARPGEGATGAEYGVHARYSTRMNETDWRKLYATNRAAIDAAQRSSRLPTLSPLGVGDEPNLLSLRRPPAAGRPRNPRAWPPVAVQDVQADSPGGTWTAHT